MFIQRNKVLRGLSKNARRKLAWAGAPERHQNGNQCGQRRRAEGLGGGFKRGDLTIIIVKSPRFQWWIECGSLCMQ